MKKTRFLWMLGNEKERISSDRLLRFRQGRKELSVRRVTTDDIFFRDTALIPGDNICAKFKERDSMCIYGKVVKFQYSTGSSKKDKRFSYNHLIIDINKDTIIRLSPCCIIDKKRKIKLCPLKFINIDDYVCKFVKH